MEKLRIGIIGCGNIMSGCHAPAYLKMDHTEVLALCDLIPERTARWAKEFPKAQQYTDYTELLKRTDIDAVDICLPNYLHAPVAIAALKSGKHVFCEKPDSISVQNVEEMKRTAEECGKVLMVMRNNRYVESSMYAKRYIESGKAGEIYAGHCAWQRRRGTPGSGWFTDKARSGGGPLIDLGVHMIDLAIWLMGSPRPVSVSGSTYRKFEGNRVISDYDPDGNRGADSLFDVEDLAMGFVKFDNGACLTIEFSWASNIPNERKFVQLYGDKAGIFWEDDRLTIHTEEDDHLVDLIPRIANKIGDHEANLRHFADVLLNGAKPVFVPQQGVDMVKILMAIYESAQTGHEVRL